MSRKRSEYEAMILSDPTQATRSSQEQFEKEESEARKQIASCTTEYISPNIYLELLLTKS
jgi:hypothetical protein